MFSNTELFFTKYIIRDLNFSRSILLLLTSFLFMGPEMAISNRAMGAASLLFLNK